MLALTEDSETAVSVQKLVGWAVQDTARESCTAVQSISYSWTQIRKDIWNFDAIECRERSITKIIKSVEQTVAKFLIELSPALLRGVQLR